MAEELQFRTCKLWQTIAKSREYRRGALFYRGKEEFGRGCFETRFVGGEREFWVVAASHWLSCGGCSLAGLLLSTEKIFCLPAGVCKASFLLLGYVK